MANYGASGGWGGPPPPHPDQIFRGGYAQGGQYYHLQRDGHPGYPNHHADSEGYTYDYIDDTYIGPRGGYTNRGNGQYNFWINCAQIRQKISMMYSLLDNIIQKWSILCASRHLGDQ